MRPFSAISARKGSFCGGARPRADRISVSESIDHVLMAVFGGISGSAVADTSSIGSILIPMMTDSGYDKDFSVAVTVTSSCQGVMMPPSHNMILFAMAAMGN